MNKNALRKITTFLIAALMITGVMVLGIPSALAEEWTGIDETNNNFLSGCYVEYGGRVVDSIWSDVYTDNGYDILPDTVIDLNVPNYFTQCILTPCCSEYSATYKILSGSEVISDNAPYLVSFDAPGTASFTVEVTANDLSTRDYTVNVTRAVPKNEAKAYIITLSNENDTSGNLDEIGFNSDRYLYDIKTHYSTTYVQIDVTPIDSDTSCSVYNNGNQVSTGLSAVVNLSEGLNEVKAVLTSATGRQKTYTFRIFRGSPLDIHDLSVFSILSDYISDYYIQWNPVPGFSSSKTGYEMSVPNGTTSIYFNADPVDRDSAIVVRKGSNVLAYSEETGYTANLETGLNVFTFTVSNPAFEYTKTYTVNVTRAVSNSSDADLCNIFVNSDQLEGFRKDITQYSSYGNSYVTITPYTDDTAATYSIYKDGNLLSRNTPASFTLSGSSGITAAIVVTAADGSTTKTYSINIGEVSSDADIREIEFYGESGQLSYNKTFGEGIYSCAFDTAYADASISMNIVGDTQCTQTLEVYKGSELLWQGAVSDMQRVDLEVGLNAFTLVVTAQDGETQNTYNINITRNPQPGDDNANVSNVLLYAYGSSNTLTTDFSPDKTNYSYEVENKVYGAELNYVLEGDQSSSSVYLNGALVAEYSSRPNVFGLPMLMFKEGQNTLEIKVTAADGVTTKTYTININREESPLLYIEIVQPPEKTSYYIGETLDLTGISVLAQYDSDYSRVLGAQDVEVIAFDNRTAGEQTVTIGFGGKTASFTVNVKARPVTGVSLDTHSVSLTAGETFALNANVLPEGASNQGVTWSSSDESVAAVDQNGTVTAIAQGNTVITVTTAEGGFTDTCDVSVNARMFTVSFDPAGGSAVESIQVKAGDAIESAPAATKPGYDFTGWYTEEETKVEFPYTPAGSITLYAGWEPIVYTITYDLGGGEAENPVNYTIMTPDFTLNNPTKVGYVFTGWTGTGLAEASINVTVSAGSIGDRTYTANWGQGVYTVTFDSQGGSIVDSIQVNAGEAIESAPDTTKSCYDFTGWYTEEGTRIGFPYTPAGSVTLYAAWTEQPQTTYLKDVILSSGTLDKAFSPTVYSYRITLGEDETSFTLTPEKEYEGASMTINKQSVTSYTVDVDDKSVKIEVKLTFGDKTRVYTFIIKSEKPECIG